MFRYLMLLIFLAGPNEAIQSQPFDTLLAQFKIIQEIFPLQDSTFILIGTNDSEILVERINHRAEVIWSSPIASSTTDYLRGFRYDIHGADSVIQITTADKHCDLYSTSLHKVFNINFSGNILDSQIVTFGNKNGLIFLLSGLYNRPRLSYIVDNSIIVMQSNGDTMDLKLSWTGGDTTNAGLFGYPTVVSMCPDGDIIVGTNGLYYFRFRLENNRYVVVDESFGVGYKNLLCLDSQNILFIYASHLFLHEDNFPTTSFGIDESHIWEVTWRNPYLAVRAYSLRTPDTLYFLNSTLDLLHKEPFDLNHISTMAMHDSITYKVGSGNIYFDHGLLQSEHQVTHHGPQFYDVEIVDFQPGPYDDVKWQYGFGSSYLYDIPHASVTVKNNCEYTIENLTIHYGRRVSFCSDTFWERQLTSMNLQPGETKTFDLIDIFLGKEYPHNNDKVCVYAIQPDNRFDDYFDDNELCKKIELLPAANMPLDFPINHTPSAVQDFITFVSPEKIDFELTIYAYNGVLLFKGSADTYSGSSLDLSYLPAGLYILEYYIPESGKRQVEKILKY